MSIPWETAADLETAINSKSLYESDALDGKRDFPTKNAELAKDVCAMTVDGGVLIYGVDEGDDNLILEKLSPIDLEGQRERVDNIVMSGVKPRPKFKTYALPLKDEKGYLVIEVPASALAPHMVEVKGEKRYYGRASCTNVELSEAQVAALYERRQRIELDSAALLEGVIAEARYEPSEGSGYVHVFVKPVVAEPDRWEKLPGDFWGEAMRDVLHSGETHRAWVEGRGLNWTDSDVDRKLVTTAWDQPDPNMLYVREVEVHRDGTVTGFYGGAIGKIPLSASGDEVKLIWEQMMADHVEDVFAIAGKLLQEAGYVGPVHVGVCVTGIEGVHSAFMQAARQFHVYGDNGFTGSDYKRTRRVEAEELLEPQQLVRELMRDLFEKTVGNRDWDVFERGRRV